MSEYIEREAISEEIRKFYYKILRIFPMGKDLTVVLIERKEQYSTLQPPTLPRCGMGGGLSKRNILLAQCMTALFVTISFLTTGIHGTTAPTAEQRWTDVTAIAIWYEQEQMQID